ncbi:MAG: PP2C family protein-serine/threonine phosphatase [Cytophagales bacterium]
MNKHSNQNSTVDFKQLELNALLEITQAINSNTSEENIYKIYHFTLRANLIIKKMALFVLENNSWNCKLHFGCSPEIVKIDPAQSLPLNNQISIIEHNEKNSMFKDFDVVIPVAHKNQLLAYVLVDGDEAFGEDAKTQKFKFIQTLSNILLVAIENKRFARKQIEQEALRKELEIAAQVQSMLIPGKLPNHNHFQLHSTYFPHQTIGGDYYDYINVSEDCFYVCIADVSGKGIPAAIFMSNFQATLRTLIAENLDLKTIIRKLNTLTQKNTGGDYFVTFFIALIDIKAKSLTYVNAGHNAPYLLKPNEELLSLNKGSVMIGAFEELPFVDQENIKFEKGDLLFMYTDGLVETNNEEGVEFGEENLEKIILKYQNQPQESLHQEIIIALDRHKGLALKYKDDVTLFSMKMK